METLEEVHSNIYDRPYIMLEANGTKHSKVSQTIINWVRYLTLARPIISTYSVDKAVQHRFNHIPTSLCHIIYYCSDKSISLPSGNKVIGHTISGFLYVLLCSSRFLALKNALLHFTYKLFLIILNVSCRVELLLELVVEFKKNVMVVKLLKYCGVFYILQIWFP